MISGAIRGATAPVENTRQSIATAAVELVSQICLRNQLQSADIVYIMFSATQDLDAAYPAEAVRAVGFQQVPMFCVQEMHVVNSLAACLRVLVVTNKPGEYRPQHVYLGAAQGLRPDLVEE